MTDGRAGTNASRSEVEVALRRVTAAREAQRSADAEYRAAVHAALAALEHRRGCVDRVAAAAGVTRQAIRKMLSRG